MLHEDRPGALQGGGGVGRPLGSIDVGGRRGGRVETGIRQQRHGQWLQPRFPGDLGLGPPLGLVGEVDVLQPGFGAGGQDLRPQGVVELPLGLDRFQDRLPPPMSTTSTCLSNTGTA